MSTRPNPEPYFTSDSTSEELAGFDGKAYAENIRLQAAEDRRRRGLPTIEEELDAWVWVPNDTWRRLEGILAGSTEDTSVTRSADRAWEWKHEERKFGSFSGKQ